MTRHWANDDWTLFLDRDGVLNRRLVGDYIRGPQQFEWLPGVLTALVLLRPMFRHFIVVTNQQGIGKGYMTEADLALIHVRLIDQARAVGVHFDGIYHCPSLATANDPDRKPSPGMALRAQADFPDIVFERSVMVGDSPSDVGFGESLGMYTVGITTSYPEIGATEHHDSLLDFAHAWVATADALR